MVPHIRNLPSTTFGGKRLSRTASAEIHETVQFCGARRRSDLVRVARGQVDWHTPGGAARPGFGLDLLGALPRRSVVRLPPQPLELDGCTALQQPLQRSSSPSLSAVERELEALFPQALHLWDTLHRVIEHAAPGRQRERPGRSHPQQSRRPSKKWRKRKPADPPATD